MSGKNYVLKDDDLLSDLNTISDFVIGNQAPEDLSYNARETLPESLSYAMIYPENSSAVKDARAKVKKLLQMVQDLDKKLIILETKNQIKKKKSQNII